MFIDLKTQGSIANRSLVFLKETYSMLTGFTEACEMLSGDLNDYYDEEFRMMGVSLEECILMKLQTIFEDMTVSNLADIAVSGYFSSGIYASKYIMALTNLDSCYTQLLARAQHMDIIPEEDLKTLGRQISYRLGDLVFAFSNIIFDPVDARWILENTTEEVSYCQVLQQFFAEIGIEPMSFAKHLVELQHKYISVIPLFEQDPDTWCRITKDLHPSLVDTLTEYGTYITILDVKAFKQGILTIDENYLEILREREENKEYIANVDPDAWQDFLKLVRDDQVKTILSIENYITFDLLQTPIEEKKLTDEYIKFMLSQIKGKNYAETHYFD